MRKLALKWEKERNEKAALAEAAAAESKQEIKPLQKEDEKVELPATLRTPTTKEIQPVQESNCSLNSPLQSALPAVAEDTYPASVKALPLIQPSESSPLLHH